MVNWLVYIALEPIARRRWPQLLVGWNRLLLGRIGDPLVGRDLVLGVFCGLALVMVVHLSVLAPHWLGTTGEMPHASVISSLSSIRHLGHFALWSTNAAVVIGFGALLGYLINRSVLRHAAPAVVVLFVCLYFGFADRPVASLVLGRRRLCGHVPADGCHAADAEPRHLVRRSNAAADPSAGVDPELGRVAGTGWQVALRRLAFCTGGQRLTPDPVWRGSPPNRVLVIDHPRNVR
ncbi:MAG: hypothetical protein IPK97_15355 [Ahniella sp.]|nr:hypothetical protein [Ahniella sp.]